jgi:peptide/nickel transport system substrate-binding protein
LASYTELKSDSNLIAGSSVSNQFSNVRIRSDHKPGSDPKVRQALRLGIDRDQLNKVVFQGLASIGEDNPVGPLYGNLVDPKALAPTRDVDMAKKLLSDAGYANGLTLDFAIPKGEENSEEIAQVLQAQWADIGVTVNLKVIDQSVYYGDATSPLYWLNADLAVTFWASRPDPQLYLNQLYKTGAVYNEAHYSSPDLDKLIDQAGQEMDMTKRAAIFSQIQKLLIADGPSYIPYFQPIFYAQAKTVGGITISPDPGLTSFATATVSQ